MFTELETRKRSIIYIRAILSLIITLLGVYQLNRIMESAPHVIFYLVVVITSNIIFILLPGRFYEGTRLHYIIFILDMVLLALGAYWLTELDFLFFMMIFFTVFISALSQSVKLSLLVALVVNLFYFYIKSMLAQNGIEGDVPQAPPLLNIPFFFMVALHSSYMAEKTNEDMEGMNRLKKSNQALTGRVNEINEELDLHMEYTSRMFDAFREGVIILDAGGIIRYFNKKCENIFGIKRGKAIHFLYKEVHELGDVVKMIADIKQKKQVTFEKEISLETGGETRRIVVNTGYINSRAEDLAGYLVTIRLIISAKVEGV